MQFLSDEGCYLLGQRIERKRMRTEGYQKRVRSEIMFLMGSRERME